MIKSTFRILWFTIFAITLLIGGFVGFYFVKNYIKDQSTLKRIPAIVNWVENFYTKKGHYPAKEEFDNKFPDFRKISKRGYTTYSDSAQKAPQDFSLPYDLSKERKNAIGTPSRTLFYDGYYNVRPCPRWGVLGLESKETVQSLEGGLYVYPPEGMIFADFYAGEIYFSHIENHKLLNGKTTLLSGLNKPRGFYLNTGKVLVTDGPDVFTYDWVGSELKLKNPQKIGQVPTGCPVS